MMQFLYIIYVGERSVNKLSKFQLESRDIDFSEHNKVPKIIWAYWDSDMPSIVKKCIDGWKKYNPDYNIIVLNKNNYKKYIDIPDDLLNNKNFNDSAARFSDLLRLFQLTEYGGIWIDS